jgi:diguanylate cyclase (GGDEF)-like protein
MRALLLLVLSELCFTTYANFNDPNNLLGHLAKMAAYIFLYRAVFIAAVREPFQRLTGEIERRRLAESRMQFLAFHDPLTELPNRVLAREHFSKAAGAADRTASKMALLFLDLDDFKKVNDSLGHAAGDLLLRTLADRLLAIMRRSDTVARLGGDEFLVIIPDLADPGDSMPLLDKLQAQIGKPIALAEREFIISLSIGVAIYPDDSRDFDILTQQADGAMYRAKQAGGNRAQFFSSAALQGGARRQQRQAPPAEIASLPRD